MSSHESLKYRPFPSLKYVPQSRNCCAQSNSAAVRFTFLQSQPTLLIESFSLLLQLYKGLDIVTNKVTAAERLQVKHYLLDFLSPNQHCTVVDFRDRALPIVSFTNSLLIVNS